MFDWCLILLHRVLNVLKKIYMHTNTKICLREKQWWPKDQTFAFIRYLIAVMFYSKSINWKIIFLKKSTIVNDCFIDKGSGKNKIMLQKLKSPIKSFMNTCILTPNWQTGSSFLFYLSIIHLCGLFLHIICPLVQSKQIYSVFITF